MWNRIEIVIKIQRSWYPGIEIQLFCNCRNIFAKKLVPHASRSRDFEEFDCCLVGTSQVCLLICPQQCLLVCVGKKLLSAFPLPLALLGTEDFFPIEHRALHTPNLK